MTTVTAIDRIRECLPEIALLEDAELRSSIERIWLVAWQESAWEDLRDCAFAAEAPEFRLIDHVRAVVQGCEAAARQAVELQDVRLDTQFLLALALLHDVSKLVEIEPDAATGARQSQFGRLIQHGVYTAHLAMVEKLPVELVHSILTHTPYSKLEPQIAEGVLHKQIDLANAESLLTINRNRVA